jgi:hypothetical protein
LISALFIDFDNVHSMLCDDDPNVGARFANRPLHWLKALESDPEVVGGADGAARRIVSRRCYASPGRITPYRRNFTQTGFEVVDCPPLTTHMKNSADITIVMDVMDYVARYPQIEEYIILSADADFVPVLNRLRKEMKRTAIFTAANTSAAYRNCADRTIDTQFFATHLGGDAGRPVAAAPVQKAAPKPATTPPAGKTALDTALAGWSEADRDRLGDFVADVANAAQRPIPMLPPGVYTIIFDAFAAYYRGQPQSFYDAVASVATACGAAGFAVAQQDIRFIGTGISIQGYRFGPDADPATLASLWRLQLFDLCDAPEWMREDEDPMLIATWCHASGETIEAARDDFLDQTAEETGDAAASLGVATEL